MFSRIMLSAAVIASPGLAQQARPPVPPQIPNPQYATTMLSIKVNAPIEKVWARVGGRCGGDQGRSSENREGCKQLGDDSESGAIQPALGDVVVGRSRYSYTYARAPRRNAPYNLYHGTVEASPIGTTRTLLRYVLFFDVSMLDGKAARERYMKESKTGLDRALRRMKRLAERSEAPRPATEAAGQSASDRSDYLNPAPRYVSLPMQIEVDAPADLVWSKIGHFCDIGRLGPIGYPTCEIISGVDGEYGVVRNIGREVLVGKANRSYTYAQQLRVSGFYSLYHGTIEARAVAPGKTTLHWTLFYDNSNLAGDEAVQADIANRRSRFIGMLEAVKALSEGRPLPPEPIAAPRPPTASR